MPRSSLAKNFFVLSITAALITFAAKASFAQKLFDGARFGLSHRKPWKTADAIISRYARDQLPPTSSHGGTRRPGQPLDEEGCLYRARRVLFARDGLLKNEMLTPAERVALTDELLASVHGSNRHDGEAFHLLAILSFHEDKIHRATVYSARAARAAPKSSCYASNFGYFLQTRGSQDEAQILYEHARKLDPTNTATTWDFSHCRQSRVISMRSNSCSMNGFVTNRFQHCACSREKYAAPSGRSDSAELNMNP